LPEEILISVIFPALNEEKLITNALSQFTPELKKKYSIEVIVSDGGSSDATVEISARLADKVVYANAHDIQNIAMGRNLGAKNSAGSFYYIMNADTLIKDIDKHFDTTIKEFNDPGILALTCKVKVFPGEEKLFDKLFHLCYNNYVRVLNIIGMGMGRGECHMMRKEIFHQLEGYNESMAAGEDYDFYRRIKKHGKIKFLSNLTVFESPRRYRKFGYPKVFWDWTKNAASVLFKNKAISKIWDPVR
jgi:glycosyltransferase involved in cell wall biosynthesis